MFRNFGKWMMVSVVFVLVWAGFTYMFFGGDLLGEIIIYSPFALIFGRKATYDLRFYSN